MSVTVHNLNNLGREREKNRPLNCHQKTKETWISRISRFSKKGLKTILIGGELKGNTEAIVGEDAILQVKKYNFTKGFFGTNGITLKNGLTTPDVRESLLKKVAMDKTKRGERYILADSSKFGQISAVTFGNFEGIKVITNEMPEEKYAKKIFIKVV